MWCLLLWYIFFLDIYPSLQGRVNLGKGNGALIHYGGYRPKHPAWSQLFGIVTCNTRLRVTSDGYMPWNIGTIVVIDFAISVRTEASLTEIILVPENFT